MSISLLSINLVIMLQLLDTAVWMCKVAPVIQERFSVTRERTTGYLLLLSEDSWNNWRVMEVFASLIDVSAVYLLFFSWAFSYTVWISFWLTSCFLGCFPVMEFIISNIKALLRMSHSLSNSFLIIVICKMLWRHISQNKASYLKFCLSLFCKSLMEFIPLNSK